MVKHIQAIDWRIAWVCLLTILWGWYFKGLKVESIHITYTIPALIDMQYLQNISRNFK